MRQDVTRVVRIGFKWGIELAPDGVHPMTLVASFWLRRNAESVAAAVNSAYWLGWDDFKEAA